MDSDLSTDQIIDAVFALGAKTGDVGNLSVAFLPPKPPEHGCGALLLKDKVEVVCASAAPTTREAALRLLQAAREHFYG